MLLWCVADDHFAVGLPIHAPLVVIAPQFLQDVVLAILVVLSPGCSHSHAY